MTEHESADQTSLERRYRRLLGAYPAGYRSQREEEMVGVLLSSATPGQRRPTMAEAVDLLVGGLGTRVRHRGRGRVAPSPRAEAVAVISVLLPIVLAARSLRLAGIFWHWRELGSGQAAYLLYQWPYAVGWVLVAVLVIVGRHRAALVVAVMALTLDASQAFVVFTGPLSYLVRGSVGFLVIEGVATVLLVSGERVQLGVDTIRPRGLAITTAVVATATLLSTGTWMLGTLSHLGRVLPQPQPTGGAPVLTPTSAGLVALVVGCVVAAACIRSSVGLRVAVIGASLAATVTAGRLMGMGDARTRATVTELVLAVTVAVIAAGLILVVATVVSRLARASFRAASRA